MLETYHATLKNGLLEWGPGGAPPVPEGESVPVEVVVKKPKRSPAESRERLLQIFENLKHMDTFSEITDPVAWQREIREDRPLPDREE